MKPDISEFSYGFALTSELVDRYGLRPAGAPVFPSLLKEGQPGGGYDVHLPVIALFLQFKLCNHMERGTALHSAAIGLPHYRFELRPLKHSDQHNLLMALQAEGNDVYYAAPEFHLAPELNDAFAASDVVARSSYFAPNDIGTLPDEHEHFVAFHARSPKAWMFSEPREIRKHSSDMIFGPRMEERLRAAVPSGTVGEFLRVLGDTLLDVYERVGSRRRHARMDVSSFRVLRGLPDSGRYAEFVSHALFGCQLLLLVRQP